MGGMSTLLFGTKPADPEADQYEEFVIDPNDREISIPYDACEAYRRSFDAGIYTAIAKHPTLGFAVIQKVMGGRHCFEWREKPQTKCNICNEGIGSQQANIFHAEPKLESEEIVDGPEPAQIAIAEVCDEIKELLLEKNRAYGNSALNPVRIFSKASAVEQINVRIDDKLSRLVRGQTAGEDVEFDLIGYLVLKRVWRKMNAEGGER